MQRQIDTTGADFILGKLTPPPRDIQMTPSAPTSLDTSSNPYSKFNTLLMSLLTRRQQMGTRGFAEQGLNAQDLQTSRVSAQTPADLIGASPSVQNSVRSASAGAVDPTIQSANQSQQTFSEQLRSFSDSIGSAQNLLKEYQAQEDKLKTDAGAIINFALETGGSAGLETLLQTQPDIFKKAGFDSKTISGLIPAIKKQEAIAAAAKLPKATESDKDLAEVNAVTDRLLATRGNDGFIDPQKYLSERAKSRLSTSDFDARMAHLLSPQERQRLLGTPKGQELTVDQSKARGFANSAAQAETDLTNSKYNPSIFTLNQVPSRLQSSERQVFERAARAFVNSILRRESGATITDDEFKNKYAELIPSPGDSPETIQKKKDARALQIKSLQEAGLVSSGGADPLGIR